MKRKLLIFTIIWLLTANAFAQNNHRSKLTGLWINTQYDYFKNQPSHNIILFRISPWFMTIDSLGKCSVVLLYEQRVDLGYPIGKKSSNGIWEYHYKKNYNTWLYSVEGNDSLMVYGNGNTPGAGIIFKRYSTKVIGTNN